MSENAASNIINFDKIIEDDAVECVSEHGQYDHDKILEKSNPAEDNAKSHIAGCDCI